MDTTPGGPPESTSAEGEAVRVEDIRKLFAKTIDALALAEDAMGKIIEENRALMEKLKKTLAGIAKVEARLDAIELEREAHGKSGGSVRT